MTKRSQHQRKAKDETVAKGLQERMNESGKVFIHGGVVSRAKD